MKMNTEILGLFFGGNVGAASTTPIFIGLLAIAGGILIKGSGFD